MGDVSSSTMKISASVFKSMINRVNKFISKKGRDPEIVFLGRGSRDYITYERFKEMLVRWNKYKKENGREPAYVWIVPAASQVSPPSPPPSPPSPPPSKRLGFGVWGSQGDIKIAYENGASGVVLFRYGLVAKDFFK